jgi:hypothetical protein
MDILLGLALLLIHLLVVLIVLASVGWLALAVLVSVGWVGQWLLRLMSRVAHNA